EPGDLEIGDFDEFSRNDGHGVGRGKFDLRSKSMRAVGTVTGLMGVRTHHPPVASCQDDPVPPTHWELELDGVVVGGAHLGDRFRATAVVDQGASEGAAPKAGTSLVGTLRASLESDCQAHLDLLAQRVALADLVAQNRASSPSCTQIGCLESIGLAGEGV